jgi:heme oxygenase-like protein
MPTTADTDTLGKMLAASPLHRDFVNHRFFSRIETVPLNVDTAGVFLGQWWHPLHYFPTFLARCTAVVTGVTAKSAIAHILNQELGCGDSARAHEVLYANSMAGAGFDPRVVTASPPFPQTAELVRGYEVGSATEFGALGCIFATEVTDLQMVSGIGLAVERATGSGDLEWVRIHVDQEPDHVEDAGRALVRDFDKAEVSRIVDAAEELWRLWAGFFDRLDAELVVPT